LSELSKIHEVKVSKNTELMFLTGLNNENCAVMPDRDKPNSAGLTTEITRSVVIEECRNQSRPETCSLANS
jgi:hypothetical protein